MNRLRATGALSKAALRLGPPSCISCAGISSRVQFGAGCIGGKLAPRGAGAGVPLQSSHVAHVRLEALVLLRGWVSPERERHRQCLGLLQGCQRRQFCHAGRRSILQKMAVPRALFNHCMRTARDSGYGVVLELYHLGSRAPGRVQKAPYAFYPEGRQLCGRHLQQRSVVKAELMEDAYGPHKHLLNGVLAYVLRNPRQLHLLREHSLRGNLQLLANALRLSAPQRRAVEVLHALHLLLYSELSHRVRSAADPQDVPDTQHFLGAL